MAGGSLAEVVRHGRTLNGQAPPAGVAVVPSTRRRPGLAAAGAGLVVFSMLVGAWMFLASSRTIGVLVAARDLAPGEQLDASDVRVVQLSRPGDLRAVMSTQQELVVGRTTRGPVPAGTLLNTSLFVDRDEAVPAGQVVVGLALSPGSAPSGQLAAGDRVELLAVARSVAGSSTQAPPARVLAVGSVWSVEPIGSGSSATGKIWVSLLVPQASHGDVAQAAADDRLRIGLLGADQ